MFVFLNKLGKCAERPLENNIQQLAKALKNNYDLHISARDMIKDKAYRSTVLQEMRVIEDGTIEFHLDQISSLTSN